MTGDTLKHIKAKRHAWNKYLATRRHIDYEEYKHTRNITNEHVKTAKINYEKMISKKAKTEPKHFWRYVKSKTKVKGGVSNLKNSDGQYISSNQHKAELLNDFFISS